MEPIFEGSENRIPDDRYGFLANLDAVFLDRKNSILFSAASCIGYCKKFSGQ